uniref:Uncharacterized protein n=1 Tax=Setaria viridis TaxID=4556 RepID=A0A4U6T3B8_SETVI|nr:hypothetical protein SEVIR_9G371000v2 [Setaria viridis]
MLPVFEFVQLILPVRCAASTQPWLSPTHTATPLVPRAPASCPRGPRPPAAECGSFLYTRAAASCRCCPPSATALAHPHAPPAAAAAGDPTVLEEEDSEEDRGKAVAVFLAGLPCPILTHHPRTYRIITFTFFILHPYATRYGMDEW